MSKFGSSELSKVTNTPAWMNADLPTFIFQPHWRNPTLVSRHQPSMFFQHDERSTSLPSLSICHRYHSVDVANTARLMIVPYFARLASRIYATVLWLLFSLPADRSVALTPSSRAPLFLTNATLISLLMINLKWLIGDASKKLRAPSQKMFFQCNPGNEICACMHSYPPILKIKFFVSLQLSSFFHARKSLHQALHY